MPVTVYAVASALGRYPGIVDSMQRAGWEIATHGLKWIDYRDHTADAERADLDEAVRLQTELTGQRPLGLYQGRSSVNTLALGCEEGGFLYLADAYADDLPYWIEGARGPQLVVPYTLDTNDMRFATPQGFNAGDQFFAYLKDSFDTLYAEGATRPRCCRSGCIAASSDGRAGPRPWRGSSTMSPRTSGSGWHGGSTSRGIGSGPIRRPQATGPVGWEPRSSSRSSAASSSTRPRSRRRRYACGADARSTTRPKGCTTA